MTTPIPEKCNKCNNAEPHIHTTQEEEWQRTFLEAGTRELGIDCSALIATVRTTRQQAVKDAMEELKRKVEGMKQKMPDFDDPFYRTDNEMARQMITHMRTTITERNTTLDYVIRLLTSTE